MSTHQRQTTALDEFRIGGRIDLHVPLGWRWQIGGESRVLWPLRPDEHGFTATTEAQATWLVADRWRADVAVAHRRSIFEPRRSDSAIDSWGVRWGGLVAYFIEDRVDLHLQLEQTQTRDRWLGPAVWRRQTLWSLGIGYRFWGALDAPGLIEPQRLFRAL